MVNIDPELRNIESRVSSFIDNSEELRKLLSNKSIGDFSLLGLSDYHQFLFELESENIELYSAPVLDYKRTLVDMIGKKSEKQLHTFLTIFPVLWSVVYIAFALIFSNYWLLLGIALGPIAAFSSNRSHLVSRMLTFFGSCLIVYFVVNNDYKNLLLPLGFVVMDFGYRVFRKNYRDMIINRAQESEVIFLMLLAFGFINVFRKYSDGSIKKLKLI